MRCGHAAGMGHVIAVLGNREEAFLRAEGATHLVHSLEEVGALLLGTGVAS